MFNGFKDFFYCPKKSELVFVTRLAVYCDEINLLVWIDPKRNFMREALSWFKFQLQKTSERLKPSQADKGASRSATGATQRLEPH